MTMAPAPDSPLRADARANRDAIVEAAARLYADRNPAVPARDIAEAAGVGRATLARRFPTPESLRTAVLEQLVERLEESAADLPDTPDALRTFIGRALHQLEENAPLVDFVRAKADPPADAEPLLDRVRALAQEPLRRARDAGLVHPDVKPDDIRLLLFMASSATRSDSRAETRERVARLAWRAIGMDPSGSVTADQDGHRH